MLVSENDPLFKCGFRGQHIAEQAVMLVIHIGFGIVQLELELFGNEGVSVDLAVGMRHGHAHYIAAGFQK